MTDVRPVTLIDAPTAAPGLVTVAARLTVPCRLMVSCRLTVPEPPALGAS